jgi:hypothetical protein
MLSSGKKISPLKKKRNITSRSKEPVKSSPSKKGKPQPKKRVVKHGHRRTRTMTSRTLGGAGKSKSKAQLKSNNVLNNSSMRRNATKGNLQQSKKRPKTTRIAQIERN